MYKYIRITENSLFKKLTEEINIREKDRIFCRHGIDHSLDVARIAYILVLENNMSVKKDLIYAAALLHDLGRAFDDKGHREKSIEPSEKILSDCGYSREEISEITSAILCHGKPSSVLKTLGDVISKADKLSRQCFECKASSECYWSDEMKNKNITY